MTKFIIGEVLDILTNDRDVEFGYRVGRVCYVKEDSIKRTHNLTLIYEDGRPLRLTKLQEVTKEEGCIWLKTKNRIYRLDRTNKKDLD